jgi:hypothetical protein
MNADYSSTEDVSLGYICDWMSYCTHHSDMDARQYVQVDVPAHYLRVWMFYYKHHSDMDVPQYVDADVPSGYFW